MICFPSGNNVHYTESESSFGFYHSGFIDEKQVQYHGYVWYVLTTQI